MGKIIIPNAVERKPGFMYYVNGAGDICEAEMRHGGTKGSGKHQKKAKKKIVEKD